MDYEKFARTVASGNYQKALDICLNALRRKPADANAAANAGVCHIYMKQFDEAIGFALRAVALDPDNLSALDTLSHAYGHLQRWEEVRQFGLKALQVRSSKFGAARATHAPLVPNASARKKIISFSLFGADPLYCEPAVLNAVEQPRLYPGWQCRFYVDETVPEYTRARLREAAAEIVEVDDRLQRWPGTLWRFAAYDDPDIERVVFRDADSVISRRDAEAVREWCESERLFHVMRDCATHTELILAGLWGVVRGGLPPMSELVEKFLERPLASKRFADQFFLRQYVWPFAAHSLLQHDSLFGFGEHRPFPDGPHSTDGEVGIRESRVLYRVSLNVPDGTCVLCQLARAGTTPAHVVCEYPLVVKKQAIQLYIPRRYFAALEKGELVMRAIRRS